MIFDGTARVIRRASLTAGACQPRSSIRPSSRASSLTTSQQTIAYTLPDQVRPLPRLRLQHDRTAKYNRPSQGPPRPHPFRTPACRFGHRQTPAPARWSATRSAYSGFFPTSAASNIVGPLSDWKGLLHDQPPGDLTNPSPALRRQGQAEPVSRLVALVPVRGGPARLALEAPPS